MTYLEMSDQQLIQLLEGHTVSEVLTAMDDSTSSTDYKSIDDIYAEIMDIVKQSN